MEKMHISEIIAALGANTAYAGPDRFVEDISTDSRKLSGASLFVAIEGERSDGHEFIPAALAGGAAFAVAHKPVSDDERVLYVKDTFWAPLALAKYYRTKFDIRAVGITGSVGKTTTKEFIALVLGTKYKTLKTKGNQNNEIGLPNTIFALDKSYGAAVFEMGMDARGDIEKLARVARPDMGVITNIGVSHIEALGSRENILAAKLELAAELPAGAPLFLCADNDLLAGVSLPDKEVVFYGIDSPSAHFRAENITDDGVSTSFTAVHGDTRVPVCLPTIGRHNVLNALAAIAVGYYHGIPTRQAADALRDYRPAGMRQRIIDMGGITLVEDCYNASPDSMRAALATLAGMKSAGRKIAVFGDMLELGAIAERSHREIGEAVFLSGADILCAYGPLAKFYAEGALAAGMPAKNVRYFEDKKQMATDIRKDLLNGDILWVKASRGMKFEELLDAIHGGEDTNGF